jgi:hypothetical protein
MQQEERNKSHKGDENVIFQSMKLKIKQGCQKYRYGYFHKTVEVRLLSQKEFAKNCILLL